MQKSPSESESKWAGERGSMTDFSRAWQPSVISSLVVIVIAETTAAREYANWNLRALNVGWFLFNTILASCDKYRCWSPLGQFYVGYRWFILNGSFMCAFLMLKIIFFLICKVQNCVRCRVSRYLTLHCTQCCIILIWKLEIIHNFTKHTLPREIPKNFCRNSSTSPIHFHIFFTFYQPISIVLIVFDLD